MNSAKQLSIYRAIKDWCDELTQQILGQSASSVEKSNVKVIERFNRKLELEEVTTLEQTLQTNVEAARD